MFGKIKIVHICLDVLTCTGQILRYCDPAFFSPGLSEMLAAPGAILALVNHPLTWERPPTPSANAVWWRADCTPNARSIDGSGTLLTGNHLPVDGLSALLLSKGLGSHPADWSLHIFPTCMPNSL